MQDHYAHSLERPEIIPSVKRIHLPLLLAALLTLVSCGSTRYAGSGVKISEIREFAFLKPCAYMVLYDTDGGYYNQTNTDIATNIITSVIKNLTNPSGTYIPDDPYGNEMVCVVIDKQEQKVIYYAKQTPTFASYPKDNVDVSNLLHKLLKDFIR